MYNLLQMQRNLLTVVGVLGFLTTSAYGQESISVPDHWRVWMHVLIGMIICFVVLFTCIIGINLFGWVLARSKSPVGYRVQTYQPYQTPAQYQPPPSEYK